MSFFRIAQLEMLEHVEAATGPTGTTVELYSKKRGWSQSTPKWLDWIAPLADDSSNLTAEGQATLQNLADDALAHTDQRAEELVLRAALGGVDGDSTAKAVEVVVRETPIRDAKRLIFRLMNGGLLSGVPTDPAHQRMMKPVVQDITGRGEARLRDLERPTGNPHLLFFSWQSDDQVRTRKIRAQLESACNSSGLEFDEATRGNAGSIEIHTTIREKIEACGIFVADLNIVAGKTSGERKTPNPNVMYELGLADSRLPPERVILLFDDDPNDLPFDVRTRRVSRATSDLATFIAASVKS